MTEYIKLNNNNKTDVFSKAAEIIRSGGLVAFPTETVYGLGANGMDAKAVASIFAAKGRPMDNPLILHIAEVSQLQGLTKNISEVAHVLIENFWPGPMTLVFEKSDEVIDEVTAGLDTVAIRMPDNPIAHEFLAVCKLPVAAPSANKSTRPSPTRAKDVIEDLDGAIDMVIDGGDTEFGLESTVIDTTVYPPVILRPGGISIEAVEQFFPGTTYDNALHDAGAIPKSPGQKYKHYAPTADVFVYCGDREQIVMTMNDFIDSHDNVGVIVCEGPELIKGAKKVIYPDSSGDLKLYASLLFASFRDLDNEGCKFILVEGVENNGLGAAIMNRLKKSSSGRIIMLNGGK